MRIEEVDDPTPRVAGRRLVGFLNDHHPAELPIWVKAIAKLAAASFQGRSQPGGLAGVSPECEREDGPV